MNKALLTQAGGEGTNWFRQVEHIVTQGQISYLHLNTGPQHTQQSSATFHTKHIYVRNVCVCVVFYVESRCNVSGAHVDLSSF